MPVAFNSRPMRFVTADLNDPMIAPKEPGAGPRGGCFGRGDAHCPLVGLRRPYGLMVINYPMHMIGHDHIRTQFNMLKMPWYCTPTFIRDGSEIVQNHFCISNFPEQTIALIRNKGHKIRTRL